MQKARGLLSHLNRTCGQGTVVVNLLFVSNFKNCMVRDFWDTLYSRDGEPAASGPHVARVRTVLYVYKTPLE